MILNRSKLVSIICLYLRHTNQKTFKSFFTGQKDFFKKKERRCLLKNLQSETDPNDDLFGYIFGTQIGTLLTTFLPIKITFSFLKKGRCGNPLQRFTIQSMLKK